MSEERQPRPKSPQRSSTTSPADLERHPAVAAAICSAPICRPKRAVFPPSKTATALETKRRARLVEPDPVSSLVSAAEDRGFEPLRAVNPTRFPSERHRPLGESSAGEVTGRGDA